MTGTQFAALLLAAAALLTPPRSRLQPPRRRRPTGTLAAAGAMTAAAGAALAPPQVLVVAVMAGLAGAAGARRRRGAIRRRDEGRAMAAALEVLVGELRVGAHPAAAFETAASDSNGPVSQAFRAVGSRARLGADVAGGIRAVAAASSVPAYWNRLAVFWELAEQHGLAISVLARAAHRDIVDRQRFTDRIHAALAGARATATILAALPLLGIALGQLIGAHPVRFLFGGGVGTVVLVVGAGLICAGVAWADRIIDRLVR